jgi:hypothetical protein
MALVFGQDLKHDVSHGGIALALDPSLALLHQSEGAIGYGEPAWLTQPEEAEAMEGRARVCWICSTSRWGLE